MRDLNPVEMRIVDRTLYLIGKRGTVDVPVRAIVKEAKVNLGAINYYFETKENLIALVREYCRDNMLQIFKILEDKTLDVEARLISFANETMNYSLRYPNSLVLIKDAYKNADKDLNSMEILKSIKGLNELLDRTLMEYLGTDEFQMKKMVLMSAIVHPTEDNTNDNLNLRNIDTKEKQIYYLKCLFKMLRQFEC
jgi:AcrR family transcriptional regulator